MLTGAWNPAEMLVKGGRRRCDRNHANGAALHAGETEHTSILVYEPPSFRDTFCDAALKFAEGRRKDASQGVGASTGKEKAKGEQE
jgi:hypothetical protein